MVAPSNPRKRPFRARRHDPEQERLLDTFRHDLQVLARRRKQTAYAITNVGREALRAGMSYTELSELLDITKPTCFVWFGRLANDLEDGTGVPG